jgi:hypothetical protein
MRSILTKAEEQETMRSMRAGLRHPIFGGNVGIGTTSPIDYGSVFSYPPNLVTNVQVGPGTEAGNGHDAYLCVSGNYSEIISRSHTGVDGAAGSILYSGPDARLFDQGPLLAGYNIAQQPNVFGSLNNNNVKAYTELMGLNEDNT